MSNFRTYEFKIDREAGKIHIPGRDPSTATLVFDREDYQIWKWDGRHYWSGLGRPWNYASTEYQVVKIVGVEGEYLRAENVKEIRPGPGWRKAVAALIKEVESYPV